MDSDGRERSYGDFKGFEERSAVGVDWLTLGAVLSLFYRKLFGGTRWDFDPPAGNFSGLSVSLGIATTPVGTWYY